MNEEDHRKALPSHTVLHQLASSHAKSPTNSPGDYTRMLVQARPITGRTHQIRVHASSLGMPITNDAFYGSFEQQAEVSSKEEAMLRMRPHLRLMAYKLNFLHPMTGENMSVQLPKSLYPAWMSALEL